MVKYPALAPLKEWTHAIFEVLTTNEVPVPDRKTINIYTKNVHKCDINTSSNGRK